MDNTKIGKLIYTLRKEHGLTQLQLAEHLNISDKTVSKWERGRGCPDVSLLCALSELFHTDLSDLLSGQFTANDRVGGNMKRLQLYVCPQCGNVLTALTETSITCCGKKLRPLEAKPAKGAERLAVERVETDYYISSDHDMTREHYISFVMLIASDTVVMRKQYPEWNLQVRIPAFAHGRLVWYCTQHGLFYQNI